MLQYVGKREVLDLRKILVVGLGLIGGSYAKALKGFPDAEIYGVDLNKNVIKMAEEDGIIVKGYTDADEILEDMDVVIICITPRLAIDFINTKKFKKGALVTDVCGVKGMMIKEIKNSDIDYIGGHPMAGRECEGYENSSAEMFRGANYIIVTQESNRVENIQTLQDIIKYIGCLRITRTTSREHDVMIAYTSQLMHVVAATLCDNEILDRADGFSAGSLRDCTRVAKLNPEMWSELFVENSEALTEQIEVFTKSLEKIGEMIKNSDKEGIKDFLTVTCERKKRYLAEYERRY